jgi:diadenosine tetraphosphate (Ap4A) HIT family hydrolase
MTGCVFCGIVAGGEPASFVYRDEHVCAFLDIRPVNRGHLLVIPNAHATYLADMASASGTAMFAVAHRLAARLYASGLPCDGVNLLLADGVAAGQEVFHVHLHVIPRVKGDGFGFRFPKDYGVLASREELDGLALQIG